MQTGDGKTSFEVNELCSLKGLQFVHINVRSLYHKVDSLKVDIFSKHVGVVGITETWLHNQIPDELIQVNDFHLIRNNRTRCRGGGTCLYVNDKLDFEVIDCFASNMDIEIQAVQINGDKSEHNHKPIVVILAYRPPSGNNRYACDAIKDYLQSIDNLDKKEVILMGDLNWDYLNTVDIGHKMIEEVCDEFALEQKIKEATRIARDSSTLIDVILTNLRNINYV